MYLENNFKWHSRALLFSIALLKVHRGPSKSEKKRLRLPLKLRELNKYQEEKYSSAKLLAQQVQKKEPNNVHSPIRLEISIEKINLLLQHKQICAADIRCLDANSKQCLANLCLKNCLN